jgi:hypothetical protein
LTPILSQSIIGLWAIQDFHDINLKTFLARCNVQAFI